MTFHADELFMAPASLEQGIGSTGPDACLAPVVLIMRLLGAAIAYAHARKVAAHH
jgi:hypothetical protein